MNIIVSRSLLGGPVGADVYLAAIPSNFRPEFARRAWIDALVSRGLSPAAIPMVFRAERLPQLRDAIVATIPMAMIDVSDRMLAMYVKPGEPMGIIRPSIDAYTNVPVAINRPCLGSAADTPM